MRDAHQQVRDLDAEALVGIPLKIKGLQQFTKAFEEENPYSDEDNNLRAGAAQRILALQQEQQRATQLASLSSNSGGALGSSGKACDVCPEMVLIPTGSFRMGDLNGAGFEDEKPVHRVDIQAFALGKYEVTVDEFQACISATGRNVQGCRVWRDNKWKEDATKSWHDPGYAQQGNHPVTCISWDDAKGYVQWLARKTALGFRLATEAEWEYAARAGSTTKYSFGNSEQDLCQYGNAADISTDLDWRDQCNDGVGMQTAAVGQYEANGFGLHDMHGNVYEWVEDCYKDSYVGASSTGAANQNGACEHRVLRGGSWNFPASLLRSAIRFRNFP